MLLFVLYIGKCRAEKSNDKTSSLYVHLINTSVFLFIYELFSRKSYKLCSSSEIFVIIRATDFQKIFYEQNFTIDFSIRLCRSNTQRWITNWNNSARSRGRLINFALNTSRLTEVPKRARRPFCELTCESINAPGAWDSFYNCCRRMNGWEHTTLPFSFIYTSTPLKAVKWKWISERLEYQSWDNMYVYLLNSSYECTHTQDTALFRDTLSYD